MDEELYLVLGCFGRADNGFVSCSSCENRILFINPRIENYQGIMDFLDTRQLFDKPSFDFNAIRNILQNMQGQFDQVSSGRTLWSEPQIQLFQKFLLEHKQCGLYLKLQLFDKQKKEEVQIPDKLIKITALSKLKTRSVPKVSLKRRTQR